MYLITGAPSERQDYLTFIMPFDFYTWALTLSSLAGVSIAMIVINKIDSIWSQEPTKKPIFMSKRPSLNSLFYLIVFICQFCFLGIAFVFGAVIDEAQEVLVKKRTHNIIESSSSKAKIFIILIWIICGYVLILSYESVLRAMLMKTYYEKRIDSIDDVLATEREVLVPMRTGIWFDMMVSDPRPKVRDLAKRAKTWSPEFSQRDLGIEWLVKGYLLMIWIDKEQSSLMRCLIFCPF